LTAKIPLNISEGHQILEMLETPRECKKNPKVRFMTQQEVNQLLILIEELQSRERLIVKFALIAGMRPGEIFGLKRGDVTAISADVSRRVYRGDIDTRGSPKPHTVPTS